MQMRLISTAKEFLDESIRPGESILLGGEAVYLTLDSDADVLNDMARQMPRPGNFRVLGEATPLYVGVPNDICEGVERFPKAKFYLLIDVYLRYMRSLKGDFLFIGGVENDYDTNMEFFIVRGGRIVKVLDKRLPRLAASDFASQFMLALNDATEGNVSGMRIYWAYPLEAPERVVEDYGLVVVRADQLRLSSNGLRSVATHTARASVARHFVFPVVGALIGVGLAAALVALPWSGYKSLQSEYIAEEAPVADIYANGGSMLQVMTSRQRMLDEPIAQKELMDKWKRLAVSAAGTGAEIGRLAVFSGESRRSGLGGRVTDFEIDLKVKRESNEPERIFAKRILTEIAETSGYEMWLRPTEARMVDGALVIEIEGSWENGN